MADTHDMESTNRSRENPRSARSVEGVAGTIMGAVVVFLLLQVIVWVICAIPAIVLPEIGAVSRQVAEDLGLACLLLCEAILVVILVHRFRLHDLFRRQSPTISGAVTSLDESPDLERHLERLMLAGAATALVATLLMGLGIPGAAVAFMVIESFAALFLLIVVATRWFLTHKVGFLAVATLAVTGYSVWFAVHHFRI